MVIPCLLLCFLPLQKSLFVPKNFLWPEYPKTNPELNFFRIRGQCSKFNLNFTEGDVNHRGGNLPSGSFCTRLLVEIRCVKTLSRCYRIIYIAIRPCSNSCVHTFGRSCISRLSLLTVVSPAGCVPDLARRWPSPSSPIHDCSVRCG